MRLDDPVWNFAQAQCSFVERRTCVNIEHERGNVVQLKLRHPNS